MYELSLRRAQADDLDFVLAAENDPEVSPNITVRGREKHLEGLASDDEELLLILGDGEPVGYALLTELSRPHGSISIYTLAVTRRNEGIGRRAIELLLERCFTVHDAHRVWLDVLGANKRAQHLYDSMGFVREGEFREAWRNADGTYDSMIYLSMLDREWRSRAGLSDR